MPKLQPYAVLTVYAGVVTYQGSFQLINPVPTWNQLADILDCPASYDSVLECIRAVPAPKIRRIIDRQMLSFYPIVDNITLVSNPAQRRLNGELTPIPILDGSNAQEWRVIAIGQNDTDAALAAGGITDTEYADAIKAAYPLGQDGIYTQYDQLSAIFTDIAFTCPAAKTANDSASVGIPTWRYYFNSSFANTQLYPDLGVYHSSEIPIVFSTYPTENTTTQEYALSTAMRGAWARFAKNPMGGPGWNAVGTGTAGQVLVGAEQVVVGGVYQDASGEAVDGTWNTGLFGNRDNALSSGVTVIDQSEVDSRCALFEPIYEASTRR
jgi:carboxylesterase type B